MSLIGPIQRADPMGTCATEQGWRMTIGPWGRAAQASGPSMHAVVTSMPCRQRRMVARSSSSTANSRLAEQLVHKKTVNGRLVPVRDVVTLVHPMQTRGEPIEVIRPRPVARKRLATTVLSRRVLGPRREQCRLPCQRCPGDRRFARYVRHVQAFRYNEWCISMSTLQPALTDCKTDRYARRYECN